MQAALGESTFERDLQAAPWWSREAELKVREDVAHVDELGRSTGPERPEVEAEEFVRACSALLDISADELQGRQRGEALTRARELIAGVGLQRWSQAAKGLSSVLRMYPDSVSRLATRAAQRARENEGFRARLEELDRRLVAKFEGLASRRTDGRH